VTSAINYLSINENFPVAGQDNDTQVFRDNFDTIKTSLRVAKEEITSIQDTGAVRTVDNDFELHKIQNAIFEGTRDGVWDGIGEFGPITTTLGIEFAQGNHQIYKIDGNIAITFSAFPGDPETGEDGTKGKGKVTLELYGNGVERIVTFSVSVSTKLMTIGFPLSKVSGNQPLTVPADAIETSGKAVLIEMWRYNKDSIFMRYLGQFE
jgi:hypothetical protein